jgi:hypothetical protein
MSTFYTLNNKIYYVPVEVIPRLTDAMCEERVTRDGKSIYVIREGLPHYLREIFNDLGEYNFNQVVAVIHNRSHPLLNLGDEALRKIVAYVGPYQGFLHQTCQTFFKRVGPVNNCIAMSGAGDFEMLKKMKPKEIRTEQIFQAVLEDRSVCENARLNVLKWLVNEKGYDIRELSFESAVANGDLKILEWARKNTAGFFKKSPLVNWVFPDAVNGDQVEVLEWARLKGAEIKRNYEMAASKGHLSVLKWAHNNKVKLGLDIFLTAARYGHLDILQWGLQENLLEFEKLHVRSAVGLSAARYGHLPILKWWHPHYKGYFEQDPNPFLEACAEGHLDILKWLVSTEARIDWGSFNVKNMGANALEVIVWAVENGLDELKVKSYLTEFGLRKEKLA